MDVKYTKSILKVLGHVNLVIVMLGAYFTFLVTVWLTKSSCGLLYGISYD